MKSGRKSFWLVVPVLLFLGTGFGFWFQAEEPREGMVAEDQVTPSGLGGLRNVEPRPAGVQGINGWSDLDQALARRFTKAVDDKEFIEISRELLNDENTKLRLDAAMVLASWGETTSLDELLARKAQRGGRLGVLSAVALIRQGKDRDANLDLIRRELKSSKMTARRWAALALAEVGDRTSLPLLQDALHDQTLPVRICAACAMAELGDDSMIPFLRDQLSSPDEFVVFTAAQTLARMGDLSAAPYFQAMLQDKDISLRLMAARSLALLGDQSGYPLLGRLLDSEDKNIRFRAYSYASEIAHHQSR